MLTQRWLSRGLWCLDRAGDGPKITYVLAPFGGGSAYSLRDLADRILRPGAAAVTLQYPGRGPRWAEPSAASLAALADELAKELLEHTSGRLELIGHSLGGVLSFELAVRLQEAGREVGSLAVSAARPPELNDADPAAIMVRDEADWQDELVRNGFAEPDLIGSPELLQAVLAVLRDDHLLVARHRTAGGRVTCPLLALGGTADPVASPEHLEAWNAYTTGVFRMVVFDGGHFYYHDRLDAVGGILRVASR